MNVISACIYNDVTDLSNMTPRAIGLQAGLSRHQTKIYSTRSLQNALLINLGDQKGYELIEVVRDRSKYSYDERDEFEEWIDTKCDYVIENPL